MCVVRQLLYASISSLVEDERFVFVESTSFNDKIERNKKKVEQSRSMQINQNLDRKIDQI